jgi:formylglycine-generating enzyme required for sulfatase activity
VVGTFVFRDPAEERAKLEEELAALERQVAAIKAKLNKLNTPAGGKAPAPATARLDAAAETWALIKDSRNPEDFEALANAYTNSDLAPGAPIRAAQLRRAATAAPIPAPPVAAAAPPGQPRAASTRLNPKDGLTYVWIPPGSFTMGCSPGDTECSDDERPAHNVRITKGFWTGQTEVTEEAYQRVSGTNPSYFKGTRFPVDSVNWEEAQTYCRAVGMSLPTEAEWEYAARGGDRSASYGLLDDVAWYGAILTGPNEVGRKHANGFGLFDMLGNV